MVNLVDVVDWSSEAMNDIRAQRYDFFINKGKILYHDN